MLTPKKRKRVSLPNESTMAALNGIVEEAEMKCPFFRAADANLSFHIGVTITVKEARLLEIWLKSIHAFK